MVWRFLNETQPPGARAANHRVVQILHIALGHKLVSRAQDVRLSPVDALKDHTPNALATSGLRAFCHQGGRLARRLLSIWWLGRVRQEVDPKEAGAGGVNRRGRVPGRRVWIRLRKRGRFGRNETPLTALTKGRILVLVLGTGIGAFRGHTGQ